MGQCVCRPRQNHRLENGLCEPRPDDCSLHHRRVSLRLGQAPARRVRVSHTRVALMFASPSRATSSSAPSVTVIRAACATLRLCGALVSARARAGGVSIACLVPPSAYVDFSFREITYKLLRVKMKSREKATLDFDTLEPRPPCGGATRRCAALWGACGASCALRAPFYQHRKLANFRHDVSSERWCHLDEVQEAQKNPQRAPSA